MKTITESLTKTEKEEELRRRRYDPSSCLEVSVRACFSVVPETDFLSFGDDVRRKKVDKKKRSLNTTVVEMYSAQFFLSSCREVSQ